MKEGEENIDAFTFKLDHRFVVVAQLKEEKTLLAYHNTKIRLEQQHEQLSISGRSSGGSSGGC